MKIMKMMNYHCYCFKESEYDQEIPQSHTADQPTAQEEPQNINSNMT